LSGGLFDVVPVNRVQEAEEALQKIITELPKEVLNRLFSDNDLSDADRETILKIAGDTITPFKDKPEPESASETEAKPITKNESEPEPKSASETEAKPKPKPKPKKEPEPDQNQK
jgi:F-type H+-transporting ATPase subunit alpha